jgi:hypothetical protein
MKELATAITRSTSDGHDETWIACDPDLQKAAEAWAVHALQQYTGSNLTAALAISAAIVEFLSKIEDRP